MNPKRLTELEEGIDLSEKEGRRYLKTAEIKVEEVSPEEYGKSYGWPSYNRPLIKWQGEWIHLCRTDLCDDVATGLCETRDAEGWRRYYLKCIRLGVRLKPLDEEGEAKLRFSCIDQISDG